MSNYEKIKDLGGCTRKSIFNKFCHLGETVKNCVNNLHPWFSSSVSYKTYLGAGTKCMPMFTL